MAERSVEEIEVTETIWEAPRKAARWGRQRATKWYPCQQVYRGTFYTGKDVEPIFVEESDHVVVVTVYVYLNQREASR